MSKTKKPPMKAAATKRVLVVEDSPTQAQALGAALEAAGYAVVIASSGDDALGRLKPGAFDIVVSDIVMPGKVDGYELCRRIKSGPLRDVPVVLFTSLADPLDIIRGLECGADNFFTKSHGTEHLLQRIKVLLETKAARAQGRVRLGVKVFFLGREFSITSDREQIIDLLMSTFEDAVFQNHELLRRETELARSHQSLKGLYQLAVGLNQVTGEAEVLETALDRALELPAVQAGWISLRDGESGFRLAAARNLPPALQRPGAMEGECLCRRRLLAGDLDSVTNILECERLQRAQGDTRGLRYHATIPMWVGDRTIGVMNLVGADQGLFSDDDLKILYGVGNEIAVALERAQLQAGLEDLVQERTAALSAEIAERTKSEDLLRASEERYRVLFERSPLPMWVVDVGTLAFLAVNPAAVEHYGYSEAEFLSMTVKDIRPPEDVPALEASFSKQDLAPFRWSRWRHLKKDGTLMDVEVAAHTVQFYGRLAQMVVVNDVTERKLAEEALRESEARFRSVIESRMLGIYFWHLDGPLTDANDQFLQMVGYTREDLQAGRLNWKAMTPAGFEQAETNALAEVTRDGRCTPYEKEYIRKDGTRVPVLLGGTLLPGSSERGVSFVLDITDRRRLEDQLRQAQKMEAIGRLAGGVAHDFNNLLTVILGECDMMMDDVAAEDPARAPLSEIHKAGERAAALTRQLLTFSRRQLIEPTVFNPNTLVADVEKMLRRLIGEDIELTTRTASDLGSVHADRGQIEQVLVNLAVNARDAMPRGGKLLIETANVTLDDDYANAHADVAPGEYILLAVSDTGTGMSEEVKQHIFEPFFTTKEPGKGTGLGLATSYGIAKQFGGHIAVYSELGVGSTMKVYLPRIDAEPTLAKARTETRTRGGETILLVEDEPAVRGMAIRMLRAKGFTVIEAADGDDALRVLAQHAGTVHVLLTDVVLPKLGGRDLAEQVRAARPGIRVLFASGYTDDMILQHRLLARDVQLIQKPFTAEALARKVREVLDEPLPSR